MKNENRARYVPAETATMYCRPRERVSLLAMGADSHGGCLIVEGAVAPGGGTPPHVHHLKAESFYGLEGSATLKAGGRAMHRKPRHFIHHPRGTLHSLKNEGKAAERTLVVISPAGATGMHQSFEEWFSPTTDGTAAVTPITEEEIKRVMVAAAGNGMELVKPA